MVTVALSFVPTVAPDAEAIVSSKFSESSLISSFKEATLNVVVS